MLAGVALATAGCGAGDDAKGDYYGALNTFCASVTAAAGKVSAVSTAVKGDTSATPAARFRRITASLRTFADATDAALDKLARAKPPSEVADYQRGTAAGFRTYVTALRATAQEATKDPTALTRLGTRLNDVSLPDPPTSVAAKACRGFSPSAG